MDNLARATDRTPPRHSGANAGPTTNVEPLARDRRLADLMRAAQDGDRAAYGLLLKAVVPMLKRLVQARLRFLSPTDREDLVQDILLSLHAARATYDPARPFIPWLMSIGHNRIVDFIRRRSRQWSNEILVDEYPIDISDDSGSRTAGSEDGEALRKAVSELPQGQRTAIELLKLREMSLKEASQASGMSISALKVSVHRAIKSLRMSVER